MPAILGDVRAVAGESLVKGRRRLQRFERLVPPADRSVDPADAEGGRGGVGTDGGVVAALPEEVAVVILGRVEQLLAERLEARHVEQAALADGGEVAVHRGAGLAEVGLGLGALAVDQHGAHREADDRGRRQHRGAGGGRAVAAAPAGEADRERLAVDRDRLVGRPPLDVLGQRRQLA